MRYAPVLPLEPVAKVNHNLHHRPVGGGRIRRRYEHERAEPREEMDDFTVLARALQEREARLYFNVRLWSRSAFYEHQATATLTTVGKRDLQVWFDRVLEQQQG